MSWNIAGSYFETCSCDVVCPCTASLSLDCSQRPEAGQSRIARPLEAFGFKWSWPGRSSKHFPFAWSGPDEA